MNNRAPISFTEGFQPKKAPIIVILEILELKTNSGREGTPLFLFLIENM